MLGSLSHVAIKCPHRKYGMYGRNRFINKSVSSAWEGVGVALIAESIKVIVVNIQSSVLLELLTIFRINGVSR
ncbi:hypothetical protein D3C78_1458910 [compost metagenome]